MCPYEQMKKEAKEKDMHNYLIEKMINSIIGRRFQLGLSQKKLAEMSDVSIVTIQNMEKQKMHPKFSTLVKMARVMGLDVDLVITEK